MGFATSHIETTQDTPQGPVTVVQPESQVIAIPEEEKSQEVQMAELIDGVNFDSDENFKDAKVFDSPTQIKSDAIWDESPKKWFAQGMFSTKRERNGFFLFMVPIVIMSTVSMISLVNFFTLGHETFAAWLLGIAFEGASMATIFALVTLRKLKKPVLWGTLVLLYLLQLVGNTYSAFNHISPGEAANLFDFLGLAANSIADRRILAFLEGMPLPTIALFLFKLLSRYFEDDKSEV